VGEKKSQSGVYTRPSINKGRQKSQGLEKKNPERGEFNPGEDLPSVPLVTSKYTKKKWQEMLFVLLLKRKKR